MDKGDRAVSRLGRRRGRGALACVRLTCQSVERVAHHTRIEFEAMPPCCFARYSLRGIIVDIRPRTPCPPSAEEGDTGGAPRRPAATAARHRTLARAPVTLRGRCN